MLSSSAPRSSPRSAAGTGTVDADELVWSDNLYRIFGLEPGEIEPSARYVIDHVHPDDRERVERAVTSVRVDGLVPPVEYRIIRPDGTVRHVRATQALVEQAEGAPRRVVGSVQDATDRHRVESTIAAHLAVAESLAEWRTLEQGATGLLRSLVVALDCALGVLWVPEGDVLVAQVIWRAGTTRSLRAGVGDPPVAPPARGSGSPGRYGPRASRAAPRASRTTRAFLRRRWPG